MPVCLVRACRRIAPSTPSRPARRTSHHGQSGSSFFHERRPSTSTPRPKPALQKYAGKRARTIEKKVNRNRGAKLMPSPFRFAPHGKSASRRGDLSRAAACVDDCASWRSLWTDNPNHEPPVDDELGQHASRSGRAWARGSPTRWAATPETCPVTSSSVPASRSSPRSCGATASCPASTRHAHQQRQPRSEDDHSRRQESLPRTGRPAEQLDLLQRMNRAPRAAPSATSN